MAVSQERTVKVQNFLLESPVLEERRQFSTCVCSVLYTAQWTLRGKKTRPPPCPLCQWSVRRILTGLLQLWYPCILRRSACSRPWGTLPMTGSWRQGRRSRSAGTRRRTAMSGGGCSGLQSTRENMICSSNQNVFVGIFCCGNRKLSLSQPKRRLTHLKFRLRWPKSIMTTMTSVAATKVPVGHISTETFGCGN